jgi:peptide/nickel transport system substrate-binding protein
MVESAVTFQEMARPAGVRLTIQKTPISTYWEEIWMKKELLTGNWVGRPSIDLILSSAYQSDSTWNEAAFKSAELDRLMIGARAEPDEGKRAAMYVQVAKILQAEGGSIIPYFRDVIAATSKQVQNYFVHPSTLVDVRSVWKVR